MLIINYISIYIYLNYLSILLLSWLLRIIFAATNAFSWNPNKSQCAMVRMSNVKPMLVNISLEHLAGNLAQTESSTWVGIESAQLPITN